MGRQRFPRLVPKASSRPQLSSSPELPGSPGPGISSCSDSTLGPALPLRQRLFHLLASHFSLLRFLGSSHDTLCLVPSTQPRRGHRGNRVLRLRL